jgi:hypothetical protein
MKEALGSSETSVLTRVTGVTSQKTAFFLVTAVKNLKSYKFKQFINPDYILKII